MSLIPWKIYFGQTQFSQAENTSRQKITKTWKQKLDPQEMHLFSAQGQCAQIASCKLICHEYY